MTKTTKLKGLILAGALMLAGTIASAEGRGCYAAVVPGAIVLPDGSQHGPGALRICTDRMISPVSNLHRTFVGGQPTGMFLSAPRAIEESVEAGTAQFVFEQGPDHELSLVGYVVTARGGTTIYEMVRAGTARETESIARADAGNRNDMVVLIASAR